MEGPNANAAFPDGGSHWDPPSGNANATEEDKLLLAMMTTNPQSAAGSHVRKLPRCKNLSRRGEYKLARRGPVCAVLL